MLTFEIQEIHWKGYEEKHLYVACSLFKKMVNGQSRSPNAHDALQLRLHVAEDIRRKVLKAELAVHDTNGCRTWAEYRHLTPEQIHEIINWMQDHEWTYLDDRSQYAAIIDVNT